MGRLIELTRQYKASKELQARTGIAESIICEVRPSLWIYITSKCPSAMVDDVCQETLVGIVNGLFKFYGETDGQFWSWCYRIARNKICDCLRTHDAEIFHPFDDEEMRDAIEASAQVDTISPGESLDLDYALNLLKQAKPPCYQYLWMHYITGWTLDEMAPIFNKTYNAMRMQINRCLNDAKNLVAQHA